MRKSGVGTLFLLMCAFGIILLMLGGPRPNPHRNDDDDSVAVVIEEEPSDTKKHGDTVYESINLTEGWHIARDGHDIQTVAADSGTFVTAGSITRTYASGESAKPDGRVRQDLYLRVNPVGPVPLHSIPVPKPVRVDPIDLDVTAVALTPDGKRLAVAVVQHLDHKGTAKSLITRVHLIDVSSRKPLKTIQSYGVVRPLVFAPDGKRVAIGFNDDHGTVGVYDCRTGRQTWALRARHDDYRGVSVLAFSPDGRYLFTGGYEDTLGRSKGKPWFYRVHLASGKRRNLAHAIPMARVVPESELMVWSPVAAAFTSDGSRMALGLGESLNGRIQIWDLNHLRVMKTLTEDLWEAQAMTFSPDDRILAVAHGVLRGDSPGAGLNRFNTQTWQMVRTELDCTVTDLRYDGQGQLFGFTDDETEPMISF
jgi:WD40 repeat protein